ncbi:putative membrane protein YfcA [Rhizobium binae]|uniref:Probable membrane transporter protein n=1 Tax=Rhizobium binae TaxID=1138190 RepID=A0ABV2MDI8_9HYPH
MRDWAVPPVGFCGGLLDAIGGGGWGPVVTSTLVGRGHDLKRVIGSTNFTEFAVTLTISLTFILTLGWSELNSAIGLIIGGVIAAPFGAILVERLPVRALMVAVSMVIITTSALRIF